MRPVRHLPAAATLVAFVAVLAATGMGADGAQSVTRTFYVTVTDKDHNPVLDMKASELEVKEGGKIRAISTKIADVYLRVAVLVADGGTGAFQTAALRFLEPLVGRGEFSIISIIAQPEVALDYTFMPRQIEAGLEKIGRRGMGTTAAQLVETIWDATRTINREGHRPVILVLRSSGQSPTPVRAEQVRDALRKSGAILYTVSTTAPQGVQRPTQMAGSTASSATQAASDDEQSEGFFTLGTVLDEGAKDTGGRHEQIVATTLVPTVQAIARELLNQYEISYTLPAGTKPNDRVQVTSKRKGVVLRAPTRIAN